MKIEYFVETDSLYIDLSGKKGSDVIELSEGVVMDVDEHGRPVGLDIDQASTHLDLKRLDFAHLPFQVHQVA